MTTNSNKTRKTAATTTTINGRLECDGRTISAHGVPPYGLPAPLDETFLRCWMQLKPGDPCFVGEISRELTDEGRKKLFHYCQLTGEATLQWWGEAALSWAGVLYEGGKWQLDDFTPIYHAQIDAGWALQIMIMATGERFVITPRGPCTLPEFQWQYGQDLLEYLFAQQALQTSIIQSVITHLTSPHKDVWVRLQYQDGQEVMAQIKVLECQKVDDWIVPAGSRLISVV